MTRNAWFRFIVGVTLAVLWLFFIKVATFDLVGRLKELLPFSWTQTVWLSRIYLVLPAISLVLAACHFKKMATVTILLFFGLMAYDAMLPAHVFQYKIHVLFFHKWYFSVPVFIAIIGMLVMPVGSKISKWLALLGALVVLVGGFWSHKVYAPDVFLEQKSNGNLPELTDFPPAIQQKLPKDGFVFMLSTGCFSCYKTLTNWALVQHQNPSIKDHAVFMGVKEKVPALLNKTHSQFRYDFMETNALLDISGPSVPVVYRVQNGAITQKWVGDGFSYPVLDQIMF